MMKAAIFDLDGTLVDSMGLWEELPYRYLSLHQQTTSEDLNVVFRKMTLTQSAEYYQTHYGITKSTEQIIDEINHLIYDYYSSCVKVKKGIKEYLDQLSKHHVKMCIATATSRELVEVCINNLGLADYFDFILTCDEIKEGKEQPTIYLKAVEKMQTKIEETWVFEDAYHAIVTCKQAGFKVVGVYDKAETKQTEIKQIVDIYINDFTELGDL